MKNFLELILLPACTLFLTLSCNKEAVKAMYTSQENNIEKYMTAQITSGKALYVVHRKGSNRLVIVKGDTDSDSLKSSGAVAFHWAGYTISGSSISSAPFGTNSRAVAELAGFDCSDEDLFNSETVVPDDCDLIAGLKNGLPGVLPGQECWIIFSGKYAFGGKACGTIPANAALAYHVWVESISND